MSNKEHQRTSVWDDEPTEPWFWEGNLLARYGRWLRDGEFYGGWTVRRIAATKPGEAGWPTGCTSTGTDLIAEHTDGQMLLIEAKGWPTGCKTSSPSSCARVYWKDAVYKTLRLRCLQPHAKIAILLPEMPHYERWWQEVLPILDQQRIEIHVIGEDGEVWAEVEQAYLLEA